MKQNIKEFREREKMRDLVQKENEDCRRKAKKLTCRELTVAGTRRVASSRTANATTEAAGDSLQLSFEWVGPTRELMREAVTLDNEVAVFASSGQWGPAQQELQEQALARYGPLL